MMLSILVATKDGKVPAGLKHIPYPFALLVSTTEGWAKASNELLDLAARSGGDALFLDDDAILTDDTFRTLSSLYDRAEVFGFTLTDESGTPSTMGYELGSNGALSPRSRALVDVPAYLAHVTASALYIKESALPVLRFPVWEGVHGEDIAFTFDAWLQGFRVLYTPGRVIHPLHDGVGATKRDDPRLVARLEENQKALAHWCFDRGVMQAAHAGKIPFGSRAVEG